MGMLIAVGSFVFAVTFVFALSLCRSSRNGDLIMEECTRAEAIRQLLAKDIKARVKGPRR